MIFSSPEELGRMGHRSSAGIDVGFCSGAFDLTTVGHAQFFKFCKSLCGVLVVMVGQDRQVRHLKGPTRPIMSERERVAMVSALRDVDHCFIDFWGRHDPTGLDEAFKLIAPARYFVSEETGHEDYRTRLCKQYGAVQIMVPRLEFADVSTTNIIKRITT